MASDEPTKPVSTRRGWYFEEFEVGMVFESGPVEVTREMITSFAELTGDNNRLHVDPEFMRGSEFGDVIAHGLLLESLAIGRVADLGIFQGTTLALLSANCQFKHAATPGDQLRIELEITDKRPSSKPGRGVLFRDMRVLNQHGHLLVRSELVSLMHTSPPAGEAGR